MTDRPLPGCIFLGGVSFRGASVMQRGRGRVLLIDDVLASGGTMTASAELCQRAGYEVKGLAALIDLKIVADYRWRDMPLRASISY